MDPREHYAANRAAVTAVAARLALGEEDLPVPATPLWRVRDLLAHLAGCAADVLADRMANAAGEEWSARQVEQRRETSVPDVLAEWSESAQELDARYGELGRLGTIIAMDVITHRHDLHAALRLPPPPADESFWFAIAGFAGVFGRRLGEAGLPAVRFTDGDWSQDAGEGEPSVVVRAEALEVFRGLAGRRSEAQVRRWDWSSDPGPYLVLLSPFGPLAEADVREWDTSSL